MECSYYRFILTICVQAFFGRYEFIGLLIVGFIVGYMAHSGVFGGMWNAAVAGHSVRFYVPLFLL